jgi:hypothetical protein
MANQQNRPNQKPGMPGQNNPGKSTQPGKTSNPGQNNPSKNNPGHGGSPNKGR